MICLTDLLKVASLSELKVIAGESGLKRQINTVTLLDAPDGPKWLKGGEFVLTSAYMFDNNDALLEKYIRLLIEYNASGLGIKAGRFLSGVPDYIVRLAEEHDFPIIQIPYYLVWTDVISPFYKIKYSPYGPDKPIVIEPAMILPLFEAGKWGGKQLLLHLTELVNRPLAVYQQDKTLVLNNGIHGIDQIETAISGMKLLPELWHPERVFAGGFICCVFCLPPSYDNQREYLVFASKQEEDVREIEKLMDLLESLSGKVAFSLREKADAYRSFLRKIISFTITPDEIAAFEENRSAKKKERIYSGIIILSAATPMKIYRYLKDTLTVYRKDTGLSAETYAFEYQAQQQAVVMWEVCTVIQPNFNMWIRGLISRLEIAFAEGETGSIIFSRMSGQLKDIPQLYRQAQKALSLGERLWPHQHCHFYPDYSVYALLEGSDLEQIDFDDCILLCEHKSTMSFQPIMIAEVYIESGNYKKAAAKLFIHENTLRYRINKINELLHLDLDKPVEAYRFLEKIKLWKLKCAKAEKESQITK